MSACHNEGSINSMSISLMVDVLEMGIVKLPELQKQHQIIDDD